jgi:hypothetical protein
MIAVAADFVSAFAKLGFPQVKETIAEAESSDQIL